MSAGSGTRRVLDEAGGLRAMTGVMAIMLFLTVLAAAAGLGTASAARLLDRQLAGRLTVQIVDGDPVRRDRAAARALSVLHARPEVIRAVAADPAALAQLLKPWLGSDAADAALPIPALIDVDLRDAGVATTQAVEQAVRGAVPVARVDRHEQWMSPVSGFMRSVVLVAALVVALMIGATAAIAVLAARAGLATHQGTIEVMHMLGSTDVQVARLFQRRIAADAMIGGLVGFGGAVLVILFLGYRLAGLGSDLLSGIALGTGDWVILALIPAGFVVLAIVAARIAVVSRLRRTL